MEKRLFLATLLILCMVEGCTMFEKYVDAPRMTKDDLKAMLGNPDLLIIDVRYGRDWTDSGLKIRGAVREDVRGIQKDTKSGKGVFVVKGVKA